MGSSPACMRLRTSRTVPGEIPAIFATSRSEASGRAAITRLASRLPSALLIGRTRPSRPSRAWGCGSSAAAHRRMARTDFPVRPVDSAMARSDHSGNAATMRAAAASRSACVSGRPCVRFDSTASTNAMSSPPLKKRTATVSSPRSRAARNRCVPSITRIVCRCTRIGGRGSPESAIFLLCAAFSPRSRGESAGRSTPTGTTAGENRPSSRGGPPATGSTCVSLRL